jgi:hypothetical protein
MTAWQSPEDSANHTPLCPAGHLPLKGGDWLPSMLSPAANLAEEMPKHAAGVISPLEGEMPGRAEGGLKNHVHHRKYGGGAG